ncbi:CbtA family protein [Rhizobium sp. WYJ-E13]|uniref:CbtA family protein n=1 Tax=Rhizobium sp. WYJ-E13 TaxID=2849093 RepID=UPI001C1F1565|nr:CbtA family protein [Rhizobium sp. WYJ-E13]QWW72287.1 CbtA family protein [Rhizobium sp. WYJ-E13]
MSIFRFLVFSALVAGCLVGAVSSILHLTTTVPIVLAAETYENTGGHNHDGGRPHDHAVEEDGHSEKAGLMSSRNILTVIAMILAYVGFALLLNVYAEAFGTLNDWRQGIACGLAGFAIFSLVPAIGLPPELPGMPAAELASRQIWWTGSVVCAAGAVAAWKLMSGRYRWVFALFLVLLPFVVGAPRPETELTAVPHALHVQFIVFTLVVSLVSWQLLGASLGWLRSKRIAF